MRISAGVAAAQRAEGIFTGGANRAFFPFAATVEAPTRTCLYSALEGPLTAGSIPWRSLTALF
jgi:hypothetical protein